MSWARVATINEKKRKGWRGEGYRNLMLRGRGRR